MNKDYLHKYIFIRCIGEGAFAGTLSKIDGITVELTDVRRIRKASDNISNLIEKLTSDFMKDGKPIFSEWVPEIIIFDVDEIIEMVPAIRYTHKTEIVGSRFYSIKFKIKR